MHFQEIYKALTDPSRLRLLAVLNEGHFNVQELTSLLDLRQPTVSHHLKVLQSAGFVLSHKQGTWVYYGLDRENKSQIPFQITQNFLRHLDHSDDTELCSAIEGDRKQTREIMNLRRDRSRNFFESVAREWRDMGKNAGSDEGVFQELAKRIPDKATLLELGCGSGAFLEQILPRSGDTMGVDYSQAMLDEARRGLEQKALDVDLRLGQLEHLPVGDGTIDYATACMVFHHLAEPQDALRDAQRVLKPGGKLLIADLTQHDNEYMRERYADLWLGFDPKRFADWAQDVGFREIQYEVFEPQGDVFLLTATK